MIAGMKCCMVKMPVSSRFFFSCKARFFAGLFFDAFFPSNKRPETIAAGITEL